MTEEAAGLTAETHMEELADLAGGKGTASF